MSEAAFTVNGVTHPWRQLRSMPEVRAFFVDLPSGILGFCDHDKQTIWLANGMKQRQRRAVLQHELEHLQRGRVCGHFEADEERAVEVATAHALIPLPALLHALKWTRDVHELANELWAPADLVVVRMRHLHPGEAAAVRRVFADQDELIAP